MAQGPSPSPDPKYLLAQDGTGQGFLRGTNREGSSAGLALVETQRNPNEMLETDNQQVSDLKTPLRRKLDDIPRAIAPDGR